MPSAKRGSSENFLTDERPSKRQVASIIYSEADSSCTIDSPCTLPGLSTETSCTSLPSTPGWMEEVCYGTLCRVKAQFLDDPNIPSVQPNVEGGASNYYQLRITMKRVYILEAHDGTEIALINTQMAKALQELDPKGLARYEVYVSVAEWTEKVRTVRASAKSVFLELDIYLFGSIANGARVGKILSDTGLFLQRPDFLDSSISYNNPHEIVFPSMHGFSTEWIAPALAPNSVSNLSVDMINTVLGNLEQTGSLTALDVNTAIVITKLKTHQRQALDFIARRESHHMPESFSLFNSKVDARNRDYYEHIVTGYKQPKRPTEDFGGIIADEMGLGKTLTMISAICMTMDRAQQFTGLDARFNSRTGIMKRLRATLVICPSVLLMDGWMTEISRHIAPGFLRCTKYHGSTKVTEAEMAQSDIVLTTYATLAADSSQKGALHSVHWFRIVLDEAHSIRHQNTRQFRSVLSLSARHRWCLTGTPIQNVLNDLGALIRFLRVPQLDSSSSYLTVVSRPIENGNKTGLQRLRDLLRCICLRRTKDHLMLPDPDERIEQVRLTQEERLQYCNIGDEHKQAIDEAISGSNPIEAHRIIFSAILRLRMFCNSGLFGYSPASAVDQMSSSGDEGLSMLEQRDGAICAYCSCDVNSVGEQESINSGVFLDCSHLLCVSCVLQNKQSSPYGECTLCPLCNTLYPIQGLQKEWVGSSKMVSPEPIGHSTKFEALTRDILLHPTEKCIVFSSWKKSIHLASAYLTARGIQNCVVDGSLTLPERRQQLTLFQQDSSFPALLMTLGTGAVGLNLTVASRIHILEPQWNPSIEKQAIGRAMRLGQDKKVTVLRYITQETVEQYIQTKQEKKLYLAQLGWSTDTNGSDDDKLKKAKDLRDLLFVS
ncbi:hypothetical protein BS50DRAFT_550345 [Corynespora cassiicola Philippines]|uniref:Uncharacterized protein n=1 Tax=Corynespora cassiicola Philippines TaxID=1448308 RepID=A0A2T2NVQ8_CORCC|nr:hypothetical protein BS50DRAFT_550345 [Corynespora cassiicola Philippines]